MAAVVGPGSQSQGSMWTYGSWSCKKMVTTCYKMVAETTEKPVLLGEGASCSDSLRGEAGWGVWSCHSHDWKIARVRVCQNPQHPISKQSENVQYDFLYNGGWNKMAAIERRDVLGPYTGWPQEGWDFWSLWNTRLPAGGRAPTSSWGPAPSHIKWWLSFHCLQKRCNKYKAFTHRRGLNNLSFMT